MRLDHSTPPQAGEQIRPASPSDQQKIADLIFFESHVHRHLDWRTPLDWGWATLGDKVAVQGNLDPAALFAPRLELEWRVQAILNQAGGRPGHIFNLGHGLLPETPVENVKAVVERVQAFSANPQPQVAFSEVA